MLLQFPLDWQLFYPALQVTIAIILVSWVFLPIEVN